SFSTPQKVNNFTSIVWHFRFCQFVFCMNLFFIFMHLADDSLKLMTVLFEGGAAFGGGGSDLR
ncbi:MAG: hypothetical protein II828_08955, partial [Clostridia bacterium]|nr:hypothetical protein [Clostridia bacterium]